MTDHPDTPEPPRRLSVNPQPLEVKPIPVCRDCGKRAPWCSCGSMNYDTPPAAPEGGQPDPIPGDTDIPFDPERHDGAPGDNAEEAHLRPVERGGQPDTDDELLARAETDDQRDARHAPGNDATWGAGNWMRCPTCPRDATGREVYHHRDAHPQIVADAERVEVDRGGSGLHGVLQGQVAGAETMSSQGGPSPLDGLRVVRIPDVPSNELGALVASGGWCAPPGPRYDLFLRFCTPDDLAWWGIDWNRLVAPRLTGLLEGTRSARREVRWRRQAAWQALRGRRPGEDDWCR